MAMDLSWVVCEDCGRKPSDRRENEPIISFTLSDPVLCGSCIERRAERDTPKLNACARRKLMDVLIKLTPLAVSYIDFQVMKKGDPVIISMDHLEQACQAMKEVTLMVYGPNHKETA